MSLVPARNPAAGRSEGPAGGAQAARAASVPRARRPFPALPALEAPPPAGMRREGSGMTRAPRGHVARMECQQCSECPDCAPHSAPGTAKGEDGERPAPPRPPPLLSRAEPTPEGERRRRASREVSGAGAGGADSPSAPGGALPIPQNCSARKGESYGEAGGAGERSWVGPGSGSERPACESSGGGSPGALPAPSDIFRTLV